MELFIIIVALLVGAVIYFNRPKPKSQSNQRERNPTLHPLRILGFIVTGSGAVMLFKATQMQTWVYTKSFQKISNLSLMSEKQNSIILWSVVAVIGIILLLFSYTFNKKPESDEQNSFKGERSLTNDSYKIYLINKYKVRRNDVLIKFEYDNCLFDTVEDLLPILHDKDQHEALTIETKSKE